MLDMFAPGYKRERSPESGSTSHDEQWTEDEDGILQSVRSTMLTQRLPV